MMDSFKVDAAAILSDTDLRNGQLTTYSLMFFEETSSHGTLFLKIYAPNAAQNPGVSISEEILESYFVKPTFIDTVQRITWTTLTDSGSTVAYEGIIEFMITSPLEDLQFRFEHLFLTRVDVVLKEGPTDVIDDQSTTLEHTFGAMPLRYPYQNLYLTPYYESSSEQQVGTFYFPNLPHFNTNDFCIGMRFDAGGLWPSFEVNKLDDERFTQNVTPVLSFKSDDSLSAVVCFNSPDPMSTLKSIGFSSPIDLDGPSRLNFFEIPRNLVNDSLDIGQLRLSTPLFFSLKASDSDLRINLVKISECAPFSSQQSSTSQWFQWSFEYIPTVGRGGESPLLMFPEFEYFGESKMHFCRPADADFYYISSIRLFKSQFTFSPSAEGHNLRPIITINCFGTVSPFYRHRDGISQTSTWQKQSETPFMIQSGTNSVFSNPFEFDKSTSLPPVSTLPQIIHTTEDYLVSFPNSLLIVQHKLVVAVNGYTFATGIVFRIPKVFSVVKARGDQTPVTDENEYVTMTYYVSGTQPIYFAGKSSAETAIVAPTLKTNSVVKCTAFDEPDATTYICNPPPTDMIDLTYTMFISHAFDFQNILDKSGQPSFSVFKYHPSSDYTKPAGPLKVFEVPITIKMTDFIHVTAPSETTELTLQLFQLSTPDLPALPPSAVVLPTSQLSIQFSAAFQGAAFTAQVSYYVVNGDTSTLVTTTTPEEVTADAILTSIPTEKLAMLTSESVFVAMVYFFNSEDSSLETYLFTELFTVQPSCGEGEDVCKNDGSCGLDGTCYCAHNNWDGPFCTTCSLQCQNGSSHDAECAKCACVGRFTGDLCESDENNAMPVNDMFALCMVVICALILFFFSIN